MRKLIPRALRNPFILGRCIVYLLSFPSKPFTTASVSTCRDHPPLELGDGSCGRLADGLRSDGLGFKFMLIKRLQVQQAEYAPRIGRHV